MLKKQNILAKENKWLHTSSIYFGLVVTVLPKSTDPYTTDCSCSLSNIPGMID